MKYLAMKFCIEMILPKVSLKILINILTSYRNLFFYSIIKKLEEKKNQLKITLFKSNRRKHHSHLHPSLISRFTAYTSLAVSFSIYLRKSLLPDIMEVKDFPKAKDYSCLNKPEKGDLMAYRIELLIPAVPLQYRLSTMLVFLFFIDI